MTADDWAEDLDDSDGAWEPDFDDPDDDYREPDPEDHEIARAHEEYAVHCETVHGGDACDCRPTVGDHLAAFAREAARRLGNARGHLAIAMRGVYTVRVGRVEFTLRMNAGRTCGACGGKGWFYTFVPGRADDRPPGDNGAALCGCGSATTALAESRRYLRERRDEPPF